MPNHSQIADARMWKKWYQAGAVAQAEFPKGTLVIEAIGTDAHGHQSLTLGEVITSAGPGWTTTSYLCKVVVPKGNYRVGQVLDRLPANAVPVKLFYR